MCVKIEIHFHSKKVLFLFVRFFFCFELQKARSRRAQFLTLQNRVIYGSSIDFWWVAPNRNDEIVRDEIKVPLSVLNFVCDHSIIILNDSPNLNSFFFSRSSFSLNLISPLSHSLTHSLSRW